MKRLTLPADGVGSPGKRASPAAEGSSTSKSVSFIPLSPQSSRTIQRHRSDQEVSTGDQDDDDVDERGRKGGSQVPSLNRGSSDPLADRPGFSVFPRQSGSNEPVVEISDEDVEYLPDRFDRQGRPIAGSGSGRSASYGPWTTRSGDFQRRAQRRGDWDVSGSWQVGGTDPVTVDKMVRYMTSALEGQSGWTGFVGNVLSSGLLGGASASQRALPGHDDKTNRGRHRRR